MPSEREEEGAHKEEILAALLGTSSFVKETLKTASVRQLTNIQAQVERAHRYKMQAEKYKTQKYHMENGYFKTNFDKFEEKKRVALQYTRKLESRSAPKPNQKAPSLITVSSREAINRIKVYDATTQERNRNFSPSKSSTSSAPSKPLPIIVISNNNSENEPIRPSTTGDIKETKIAKLLSPRLTTSILSPRKQYNMERKVEEEEFEKRQKAQKDVAKKQKEIIAKSPRIGEK